MKIKDLKNLYLRSKKEYEQFRTMINALSYDQEKLPDDYAKYFKKRLKQRIENLEDTIDVHLNLISGLEKYMERTYIYKLCLLDLNEEKIIRADDCALRMIDISQSYHLYDQLDYAKPNLILQRIDREVLGLDFLEKVKPIYN